jgi:hypothetical protein
MFFLKGGIMCDLHRKVFKKQDLLELMGVGETSVAVITEEEGQVILYGNPTRREEQVQRLFSAAKMYYQEEKIIRIAK